MSCPHVIIEIETHLIQKRNWTDTWSVKSSISLTALSNDTMKFLKDVCYTITLHIICLFGFLSNVHSKHENLWSYSRHFVIETVSVNTIHMGCKCVFSIWFSVSLVNYFSIRSINLKFQEYSMSQNMVVKINVNHIT